MSDLVSVIIPVYNIEAYLDSCLKSVCEQTYRNFEVILIDDGSTDGSYEKCLEYEMKYSFIHVFRQQHQGAGEARNYGIHVAKGKYIAFVDGDDTIDDNYLEILGKYMFTGKYDVVFCGCRLIEVGHGKAKLNCVSQKHEGDIKKDFYQLYKETVNMAFLAVQSACLKLLEKEKIVKNGIYFDGSFINGEDAIFMLHYLQFCQTYYMTNETFYTYYRRDRGSATDVYDDRRLHDEIEHLKITREWLWQNGIQSAREIMSFDIARFLGGVAECVMKNSQSSLRKYVLFKKRIKLMQSRIEIPNKTARKRTAVLFWFIRNRLYFPPFVYYWLKEKARTVRQ